MNSNRKPGKRRSPELDQARCERDELQARLDRIVDITAGIIYILDPEGRFVFVNNAVEEILHYYPDELLGKHFSEIMPVHEYQRVSRAFVLPNFIGKKTGDESAPKLFDERRTGRRKTTKPRSSAHYQIAKRRSDHGRRRYRHYCRRRGIR